MRTSPEIRRRFGSDELVGKALPQEESFARGGVVDPTEANGNLSRTFMTSGALHGRRSFESFVLLDRFRVASSAASVEGLLVCQ